MNVLSMLPYQAAIKPLTEGETMGLLETVIGAAGTLSFKIKNALGVYDREPLKEDPWTPKNWSHPKRPDYGKGSFWGVTAQMNNINLDTKMKIDKIKAERKKLDSQEIKILKDLENIKTDADRNIFNGQINSIANRRIELNQQESETKAELRRIMDLIRTDYNLPEDCDASDPHWRV